MVFLNHRFVLNNWLIAELANCLIVELMVRPFYSVNIHPFFKHFPKRAHFAEFQYAGSDGVDGEINLLIGCEPAQAEAQ
jgi:hypothetical protein